MAATTQPPGGQEHDPGTRAERAEQQGYEDPEQSEAVKKWIVRRCCVGPTAGREYEHRDAEDEDHHRSATRDAGLRTEAHRQWLDNHLPVNPGTGQAAARRTEHQQEQPCGDVHRVRWWHQPRPSRGEDAKSDPEADIHGAGEHATDQGRSSDLGAGDPAHL
jgi:hypothetical protein